jgi:hypothetical protein
VLNRYPLCLMGYAVVYSKRKILILGNSLPYPSEVLNTEVENISGVGT